MILTLVDGRANRLPGGCIRIRRIGEQQPFTGTCDLDSDPETPIVVTSLRAGDYLLDLWQPPLGFASLGTIPAHVEEGTDTPIEQALEAEGRIRVDAVATNGDPIGGVCVGAYVDPGDGTTGAFVAGACDGTDGVNDGRTTVTGLGTGTYVLKTNSPYPYVAPQVAGVAVTAGQETAVTVVYVRRPN